MNEWKEKKIYMHVVREGECEDKCDGDGEGDGVRVRVKVMV